MKFFPYLLDGIHLRRIRWNVKQLYVFRDMKLVRLVPCCTITTQQDQIIRVLLGQFLEKYVHTSRIAIRHNKKTGASRYWFNSSVCIPIFTNVMARYRWTNALFTPAVFGLIDSSESCFILEHKSYFLMWMTRLVYIILQFADSLVNFFEVSMTSSLAFFGCLLLGMTFLQPWRWRT